MADVKMPEGPLPGANPFNKPIAKAPAVQKNTEEIKPVVSGKSQQKPKTFMDKLKDAFRPEDNRSVGDYIIFDIVVPSIKSGITNIIITGVESIWGGSGRPVAANRRPGQYVSYSTYSRSTPGRSPSRPQVTREEPNYLVYETRQDAENVLFTMCDYIDQYREVTVARYYELSDYHAYDSQAHNWGWIDLGRAKIVPCNDGSWYIDLPRAIYLN